MAVMMESKLITVHLQGSNKTVFVNTFWITGAYAKGGGSEVELANSQVLEVTETPAELAALIQAP